jgi:hypothetical protein
MALVGYNYILLKREHTCSFVYEIYFVGFPILIKKSGLKVYSYITHIFVIFIIMGKVPWLKDLYEFLVGAGARELGLLSIVKASDYM